MRAPARDTWHSPTTLQRASLLADGAMKLLILAAAALLLALLAAASAEYHDDTFHFTSSVGGAGSVRRGSALADPTFASFAAPPAFAQQQQHVLHVASSPVLVKSVEGEVPVFSQRHYTTQIARPAWLAQGYSATINKELTHQPTAFAQPQYALKEEAAFSGVSGYAAAAPRWRILSHVLEADPAGPYKLSYATENGIQASEQGSLIPGAEGPEGGVVAAQGTYSYTGPDGVVYSVSYIADEGGFRAAGDHLPTPPPVPAAILRSLTASRAGAERYDEQGRLLGSK